MKIMICGKGGSGKSTLTVLLAQALTRAGKRVLVVDADESNLCLHRMLGMESPDIMLESMGGRTGAREKLNRAKDPNHEDSYFQEEMGIDDLPQECIQEQDNIKLLVVGKIKEFGEGCACMIGGISKAVLSRLQEEDNDVVLIDAEAGLEHFGRQVDKGCDIALFVIDPSFESLQMAGRARKIAEMAGVPTHYVLNKMDDAYLQTITDQLDGKLVVGALPQSAQLFTQNLKGEPLAYELEQTGDVVKFLLNYRKPMTLATL